MLVERWLLDARVVDFLAAALPEAKGLAGTEREGVLEDFPDAERPSPAIIATGVKSRQTTVIILFMEALSGNSAGCGC